MSFLFKVKLPYEEFKIEAQQFKIPLKFFTINMNQITMYMLIPIGSSGLMYLYFCEKDEENQETPSNTVNELKRLGFTQVESLELPFA